MLSRASGPGPIPSPPASMAGTTLSPVIPIKRHYVVALPLASKIPILVRGDAAGLTVATGKNALIFDDREIVQLLRAAIEREGNQVAFAKRYGLNRVHLNMILNGKRPISAKVIRTLGLRIVYTATEENP
jgi:hypothetical protein